jgi:hypothetical protein
MSIWNRIRPALGGLTLVVTVAAMWGCASTAPRFPDQKQSSVRVMPTTDSPGYVMPDSHVAISNASREAGMRNQLASTGGMVGGAIGAVAGAIVGEVLFPDKGERPSREALQKALSVRYDGLVVERLRSAGVPVTGANQPANVTLVPTAQFIALGERWILQCTLEVRYSVGGTAGVFTQRRYSYTPPETKPLAAGGAGWIDHEGAIFRSETNRVFAALADAFGADWNERLASASSARTVRWQRAGMKEPRTGRLLHEMADFVLVAGGSTESPDTTQLVLLERSALIP